MGRLSKSISLLLPMRSRFFSSFLVLPWLSACCLIAASVSAQQIPPAANPSPTVEAVPLNPLVVTGNNPHSETETIAQQITEQAANLETVESQQQIARYPDVTLGDTIRRLPGVGVQYNQGQSLYLSVRGIDPNLVGSTFIGAL